MPYIGSTRNGIFKLDAMIFLMPIMIITKDRHAQVTVKNETYEKEVESSVNEIEFTTKKWN